MAGKSTQAGRDAIDSLCVPTQHYCVPRKPAPQLDDLDRKLLDLLQDDAARPLYELGDLVGLSASAVQRRLSRYRSSGVIAKQIAVLNPDAVPGAVLACVLVTLERETKRLHSDFRQRVLAASGVYGVVIRGLRDITAKTVDKEPQWRKKGEKLLTGYRSGWR